MIYKDGLAQGGNVTHALANAHQRDYTIPRRLDKLKSLF